MIELPPCPKCGGLFGNPIYCQNPYWCKLDGNSKEHLHFTCNLCKYTISKPCLDAKDLKA
jgi:hypothetical protein